MVVYARRARVVDAWILKFVNADFRCFFLTRTLILCIDLVSMEE